MVAFQIPVLLREVGRKAEADGVTVEYETGEEVVPIEDAVIEAAADEEIVDEEDVGDVELEVVIVTGCFAQSLSVN